MIWQAIPHLVPCVQAMAVCAQKPQIPFVGCPIAKTIVPDRGPPFVAKLFRWVDMVNVKHSIVVLPAADTRTAQLLNQRKLTRPISRMLVGSKAMLVPMVSTAFVRTKAVLAFYAAALAAIPAFPTRGKVAIATAIFPSAIFQAVLVSLKGLQAVAASHCYRCLLHFQNIASRNALGNFDIACRRIEDAQRQGDLFVAGVAA